VTSEPFGREPAGRADPDGRVVDQRVQWETTFESHPQMYGVTPSEAGRYAAHRLPAENCLEVLELGAGQGRDTVALLEAGLVVTALDFVAGALASLESVARRLGLGGRLTTLVHDVRQPLPFADCRFDACYSHMLFSMALRSDELVALAREVHRVLRPGGLCIYTVRHVGDAHYGAGRDLGDDLYENGGFVVRFFDPPLVERLALGSTSRT